MVDEIKRLCEVPCKCVFDMIKDKVSLKIFIWTTVCILGLVGYMTHQVGGLRDTMTEVRVGMAKIETQLQIMNGDKKRSE